MKDIEDYRLRRSKQDASRINKEKKNKRKEEENTMIVLNSSSQENCDHEEKAKTLSNKITKYKETLTNWLDDSSHNQQEEFNNE